MLATIRRTALLAIATLVALAAPANAQTTERVSGFRVSGTTFEQWFEPALTGDLQGFRYGCAARDPKLYYRFSGPFPSDTAIPFVNYLFTAQDWQTKKFTIGQYLLALEPTRPYITLSQLIRESFAGNGPMPRNDGIGLLGQAPGYWLLVNYNRLVPVGPYGALVENAGLFTYRGVTKPEGSCAAAGLSRFLVNAELATM